MPPYEPNKSMAQQRKMFVLAKQGKISKEDAVGKARASKGKNLPDHVAIDKHGAPASERLIAGRPPTLMRKSMIAAKNELVAKNRKIKKKSPLRGPALPRQRPMGGDTDMM